MSGTSTAPPRLRLTARYWEDDGAWCVCFDEFACVGQGATLEEARQRALEAAGLHFTNWDDMTAARSTLYVRLTGQSGDHYETFEPHR